MTSLLLCGYENESDIVFKAKMKCEYKKVSVIYIVCPACCNNHCIVCPKL